MQSLYLWCCSIAAAEHLQRQLWIGLMPITANIWELSWDTNGQIAKSPTRLWIRSVAPFQIKKLGTTTMVNVWSFATDARWNFRIKIPGIWCNSYRVGAGRHCTNVLDKIVHKENYDLKQMTLIRSLAKKEKGKKLRTNNAVVCCFNLKQRQNTVAQQCLPV